MDEMTKIFVIKIIIPTWTTYMAHQWGNKTQVTDIVFKLMAIHDLEICQIHWISLKFGSI